MIFILSKFIFKSKIRIKIINTKINYVILKSNKKLVFDFKYNFNKNLNIELIT